jgi:hypothetical protein
LKIYNTLALPSLYRCETWAITEQYKCRITSAEIEFMKRRAKYTYEDYKTSEDIFSGLKINAVVNKTNNYIIKYIQHVRRMDRDRQTATLNYEISVTRETKPRTPLRIILDCKWNRPEILQAL